MQTLSSSRSQSWLVWFLRGILIFAFLFLVGRLIELQLIKGKYFKGLAEGNRIRRIPIEAPRGKVLARGGEVLIDNIEVKKKIVIDSVEGFKKSDDTTGAKADELISEFVRFYVMGEKFAHAGGYVGEVNDKEVSRVNPKCPEKGIYKSGDLIGRSGLESEYECTLRGIDGEELIEVDTFGKKVRTMGRREAVPGKDIKTNISYGLQAKAFDSLGGVKGAVVITDPKGEVMVLASSPSFDPNVFVNKNKGSEVGKYLSDANLPLFDRAIGGQYHPGSVFKPLVALAALSEGTIDENYRYKDVGFINVNDYSYTNWYFTQYGSTEGEIGVAKALARSTDTFFYKVGELLGIKKLDDWAEKFNLNKLTGVDIPGEVPGLIPTPDWKKKFIGEAWYLGNTYHFSIGQGYLALSPIALNTLTTTIAAGGEYCNPKILGSGNCKNLNLNKKDLQIVKEGMEGVCAEGGTGYTFFDFVPKVACKTGTAETNVDGKTHAWFTVIAPSEFPEMIMTVLVEGGGEGSKIAGPIARKIFDYQFNP
jgi:penicillin-binding protein 2